MKTTIITALIGLTLSTPVLANSQAKDAFKFCRIIDSTGLSSSPCEVKAWGSEIHMTVAMSAHEARKTCPTLGQLARGQGMNLSGWTLQIKSPYANQSIAFCGM